MVAAPRGVQVGQDGGEGRGGGGAVPEADGAGAVAVRRQERRLGELGRAVHVLARHPQGGAGAPEAAGVCGAHGGLQGADPDRPPGQGALPGDGRPSQARPNGGREADEPGERGRERRHPLHRPERVARAGRGDEDGQGGCRAAGSGADPGGVRPVPGDRDGDAGHGRRASRHGLAGLGGGLPAAQEDPADQEAGHGPRHAGDHRLAGGHQGGGLERLEPLHGRRPGRAGHGGPAHEGGRGAGQAAPAEAAGLREDLQAAGRGAEDERPRGLAPRGGGQRQEGEGFAARQPQPRKRREFHQAAGVPGLAQGAGGHRGGDEEDQRFRERHQAGGHRPFPRAHAHNEAGAQRRAGHAAVGVRPPAEDGGHREELELVWHGGRAGVLRRVEQHARGRAAAQAHEGRRDGGNAEAHQRLKRGHAGGGVRGVG
mmetsp:Transcript_48283/g.146859  ORF Transcript_48283/g.146859 Transcript_48283/m.146859 type:complete len:428 (+) Transcript_48283:870-2153(+)